MKKTLILLFTVTLLLGTAEILKATPITFTGSSGNLAASVKFVVSGSDLLVTLANISTGDPRAPGDILTGVIFSIPGNPLLGKGSAKLSAGSIVIHGPVVATDPGGVLGGEWAYTNSLAGAFVGQQSIYSSGYFAGNARFPGTNLQGPASVDGVQYGITTLSDTISNDNGGIKNEGLIKNSVDFVLGGLPVGFKLSDISNVSFQYGTDLCEPNIPGVPVPEPGILILLGIAMTAVGVASRYVRKI